MGVVGIIAEFNPLHNGHVVHIEESKKISGCEKVIAVMSGNFVQRGEPAIFNKWQRTEAALRCGVDVVLELPVFYCLCGADYFARGAVGILESTGVVSALSFGCECGDLEAVKRAAEVLLGEPGQYKEVLQKKLSGGHSFAAARGQALEACMYDSPDGLFTKPNNGLGMEYVKALKLLGSSMKIFATHRKSGGPSASRIRKSLFDGIVPENEMPSEAVRLLFSCAETFTVSDLKQKPVKLDDFSDVFRFMLYSGEKKLCFGEGLENRFRRLAGEHPKISDLLMAVKTKRYTHTRLQRTVLRAILGMDDTCGEPEYIRLLGFRQSAVKLVGDISKKAKLPFITSGRKMDDMLKSNSTASKMLAKELEAGDIYRLASGESGKYRHERGKGIVIFDD